MVLLKLKEKVFESLYNKLLITYCTGLNSQTELLHRVYFVGFTLKGDTPQCNDFMQESAVGLR